MAFHNVYRVLLLLVTAVTSQFMPQMPQMSPMGHMPQMAPMNHYPFYPPQGHPMQMQMPNGLPGGMPSMMPGMQHLPGIRSPMHLSPIQVPLNGGRLPMVVMPHHTKKKGKKKSKRSKKHSRKRPKIILSSSSEDSDSSDEINFRSNSDMRYERSRRKGREVLTPVVSYITKEGYVVYQKKIKKDKAKDWLELSKARSDDFNGKSSRVEATYDHDHREHHRH